MWLLWKSLHSWWVTENYRITETPIDQKLNKANFEESRYRTRDNSMLNLTTQLFLFQQMKNQKTGWSYSKMDLGRRECFISCTMNNVITSSDSHDGRKIVSKWLWLCWKVAVKNKYLNNCLQDLLFLVSRALFESTLSSVLWTGLRVGRDGRFWWR